MGEKKNTSELRQEKTPLYTGRPKRRGRPPKRARDAAVTHPLCRRPRPPLPAPLGAAVHGSPARAAATAVIPSILNLTSSHTRDEVIEGNARHVRSAPIGRRQSGGRGAGAAGRAAAGDGDGGSPTRRPSPLRFSSAARSAGGRRSPRWLSRKARRGASPLPPNGCLTVVRAREGN